jgi:HPt (histidine-containing phosphotransfer) domain-containing protein
MDDFLTKPVNPDLLSVLLRRWVERDGGPELDVPEPAERPRAEGELVMDRDRLDMLRELDPGNTAYLDKAIENFVARAGESLDTIRRAVERADAAALTAAAHRLKGSALNLGLPRVGQVAYELERLGDEGSTKQAHPALAALEGALQDGVSALAGYRDEHAPGRAG